MSLIYPSLLSADFSKLGQEIDAVTQAGADGLHVDVMDGQFVPNLSFGAPVLSCFSKLTSLDIDCHLMVNTPERLIEDFVKAGANTITVHFEACPHLQKTLRQISDLGCKAGVAINPHTDFRQLEWVLDDLSMILSMTVNPGFGGQSLIAAAIEKTSQLNDWLKSKNKREHILIEVDGGINAQTCKLARDAGADILVAGSAIFKKDDYAKAIADLK